MPMTSIVPRTEVHLEGPEESLIALGEIQAGSAYPIVKEGGHWLIVIDGLASPSRNVFSIHAYEKACEVIDLLNGMEMLRSDSWKPVSVRTSLTEFFADGSSRDQVWLAATVHFRNEIPEFVRRSQSIQFDPRAVFSACLHDKILKKALRIFGKQRDWAGLYKVFELCADWMDGAEGIQRRGIATIDQIKLFKKSANHPEISGDDARHAVPSGPPPDEPMPLADGVHLIRALLSSWIEEKRQAADRVLLFGPKTPL